MDGIDGKVTSMASDAIFNVTRGTVKPWKHTALGLGMASLTGSKLTLQILNRSGHSISYTEAKALETEFAYSPNPGDETSSFAVCHSNMEPGYRGFPWQWFEEI